MNNVIKVALFSLAGLFSSITIANDSNIDDSRYDDGARWAFITDQNSTTIAVVDTFEHQLAGHITLQVTPSEIVVSDVQDVVVYIDGKTPAIYSYDLVKHTHSKMVLDQIPEAMIFHSDGAQLAVASENRIDIIKPLKQEYGAQITGIASPFSMNFDNGGYNLYVTESNTGKTLIYRNHDGKQTRLQLGDGAVSDITLSPDARLALVSQYKGNAIYVWDLFTESHFNTFQMEDRPWRPYVSSDSEYMVLVAKNGQTKVVNTWSGDVVKEFKLNHAPKSVRTGWLETIGMVESEHSLALFPLTRDNATDTQNSVIELPLSKPLNEVVVVSDSKTLFATQQGSGELFIYDIRRQKTLPSIDTKLSRPQHLVMGITNTICH